MRGRAKTGPSKNKHHEPRAARGNDAKSNPAGLQQKSLLVSITDLAHAFTMARETVSRRLTDANVSAAGKRSGHNTYALRDAVQALLSGDDVVARLDPFRQKAKLQSEAISLKLATDRGELIPRDDVRETFAAAFKPIRQTLETLPDVLERDAALTPTQVACCERAIDKLREELHTLVTRP
ncbi:MAG TPA: DUF1441 family protein [Steroidobacteraceae bacterium]|nr:DUF1441 family protein [Steroidobacteraceae bacterium]